MTKREFVAQSDSERADLCVCELLKDKTRSAVKKLFDGGQVQINGKTAKSSQSIKAGDNIELIIADAAPCTVKAENIPIEIIYQDEYLAVVNKPQGMTVHMGNGNYEGTLVNALLGKLDKLSGINGVIRPGIVHRIDKDTSGLLVVAKTDAAHLSLSKQIAEKSCKRTYLALLEGNLKDDGGRIITYIGRSPHDRIKMAVVPFEKGKLAVTDYKVEKRYRNYTLCRFDLSTGRTHQIRVHAKHLNHPVVGDKVYGLKKQKFELDGQLLHACKLSFVHPATGQTMEFEAPLPDYFAKILDKLD